MNAQYLNSLKAGIKTAIITFVTTILASLPGLMDAIRSWTVDGNPPNMDSYQKIWLAAVLALLVGIGNVVMRFLQAGGVPFIGALFDKLIGVIPDYLPPPEAPIDQMGPDVGLNRNADKGVISLMNALIIIGIIVGILLIIHFVDVNVK